MVICDFKPENQRQKTWYNIFATTVGQRKISRTARNDNDRTLSSRTKWATCLERQDVWTEKDPGFE